MSTTGVPRRQQLGNTGVETGEKLEDKDMCGSLKGQELVSGGLPTVLLQLRTPQVQEPLQPGQLNGKCESARAAGLCMPSF